MTVPADEARVSGTYQGNGTTTEWDYEFRIYADNELSVVVTTADGTMRELTLGTDYTVAGVDDDGGGSITLTGPLAGDATMTIEPNITLSQERPFSGQTSTTLPQIESALDKLTSISRQLYGYAERSPRYAADTHVDVVLPPITAGATLIGNAAGDGYEAGPSADDIALAQYYASGTAANAAAAAAYANYFYDTTEDMIADTTALEEWQGRAGSSTGSILLTVKATATSYIVDLAQSGYETGEGYVSNSAATPVTMMRQRTESEKSAPPTTSPSLRLAAAFPAAVMPQQIMLQKLRTDYLEFAAYTPMTLDGKFWHRWYNTNRIGNSTNSGAPRLLFGAVASLYASSSLPRVDSNAATGDDAQAATVTKSTAQASRSGTWTTATTVDGVADVSYSTTVGNTATYTISGVERIAWRAYKNTGNGGTARITVASASTEIDAADYDLPENASTSRRTVDLSPSAFANGLVVVPVAKGLDSSVTYTITVTVDADNATDGRVYDGGLRGYDALAYDSVGLYGVAHEKTLSGSTGNLMYYSGQTVVYALTDVTRVDWKYTTYSGASRADFAVYDANGDAVATLDIDHLDTANSQGGYQKTVASGLAKGDYFLHVTVSSTVTGTDGRIYDSGAAGFDTESAGTLGVDEIDLKGQSTVVGAYSTFGQSIFMYGGNQEYATQFTQDDVVATDDDFVTGVHNNEYNPTDLQVYVDGVLVDYDGADALDTFVGEVITVTFSHEVTFNGTSTSAVRLDWELTYSASGYSVSITDTALVDLYSSVAYSAMLVCPNGDMSIPVASAGQFAADIGGGFDAGVADGYGEFSKTAYDGSSYAVAQRVSDIVRVNDEYVVSATLLNQADIDRAFYGLGDHNAGVWGSFNDRANGSSKSYVRAYKLPASGRVQRASGHAVTYRKLYRAFRGALARGLV